MTWSVTPAAIDEQAAAALLLQYMAEVIGRYHDRAATEDEIDEHMAVDRSDDLTPPTGLFLVARYDGEPAGCVGFRRVSPDIAEVTRMYVQPSRRGLGGGGALLAALERAAKDAGCTSLRLDTRNDLVEARGLYAKHGYVEVEAFNDGPYADHWFVKQLDAVPATR